MTRGEQGICWCGKVCYRSRKDARAVARRLSQQHELNAYEHDGHWHLGHLPRVVKRGAGSRSSIRPPVVREPLLPGWVDAIADHVGDALEGDE